MATPRFDREKRRLASSLRQHRTALDMTQEEAAQACHIAPRHYQKLEAGEVNITLRTLVRVAEAFRCEVKDLF